MGRCCVQKVESVEHGTGAQQTGGGAAAMRACRVVVVVNGANECFAVFYKLSNALYAQVTEVEIAKMACLRCEINVVCCVYEN